MLLTFCRLLRSWQKFPGSSEQPENTQIISETLLGDLYLQLLIGQYFDENDPLPFVRAADTNFN